MFKTRNEEKNPNTNEKEFTKELGERCTPTKLASVAGVAVVSYVIKTALQILTNTTDM